MPCIDECLPRGRRTHPVAARSVGKARLGERVSQRGVVRLGADGVRRALWSSANTGTGHPPWCVEDMHTRFGP